jgi:hypothetical protein
MVLIKKNKLKVKENKMNYTEDTILKNKIEAVNKLHKFINEKIPLVIEELKKGFKIKIDYSFDKKTSEKLDKIIETEEKNIRVYFSNSAHSSRLVTDVNYQTAECGCNYFKTDIYLLQSKKYPENGLKLIEQIDFKRNDNILFENVKKDIQSIKDFENVKKEIEEKINELKYKNNYFLLEK